MVLVRIDNQLRIDPETAQRLVHLLTALHRHVEVALAAEKQRRRLNAIGVQERIGDLYVRLPRFRVPRWSNLVVVLNDVLVSAVERDGERRAGAARRSFEPRVSRNEVVSENSTLATTTDAEPIRIRNAHLDHVIDARE